MESAKGIVTPMITPLQDDQTLDHDGLERLVEHLVSGGVHGLFLMGTTGEGPSLRRSLRVELVQRVCDLVGARVPVWVGLVDSSFRESINMAQKVSELGADAVVITPPIFYPVNQENLTGMVRQLLAEVNLPVFLYNNPGVTQSSFSVETVSELLADSRVGGMKDSSGDMRYFQKLSVHANTCDKPLFMGPEDLLLPSLLMGGSGGVPGGSNLFPQLHVGLFDAVTSGDLQRARVLHQKISGITEVVYSGNGFIAERVINGIKTALHYMGICSDHVARPLASADGEKAGKIKTFIDQMQSELASPGD